MLDESSRPVTDEPAKKEKAEVAPPAPSAAPATPPPEENRVKVSKRPVKRPELPTKADPAPAAPATPVAAPAAPETNWEETLLEDEKAALEDARFAESVNPKHKGLADKTGKFFREQKKFLEANPDASDDDPKYKALLATMPTISAADKREIAESRIESRVAKKYDSKLIDLQHELYVRDEEPKVTAEADQIRRHMAFNALPKEMLDVLNDKTKGLTVLQSEYPDELEVAGNLINTLTDDAKELLRIWRVNPKTNRTLGDVASTESHPKWVQHNRIATMVNAVCEDFQKHAPQTDQVRDGKWFVTRDEWAQGYHKFPDKYWTFTNSDADAREIINRAMSWMPGAVSNAIKARQAELKKRRYVRERTEAPPPVATTPPQPSASPATPRPAPAPAPTNGANGQLTQGQLLARRLAVTD